MRMMKPTKIVPSLAFNKMYKNGGDAETENNSPQSKRASRANIAPASFKSGASLG